MLLLQLTSLCVALTTIFFGAMYSRWPPAASIWSSLRSPIHDKPTEELPRIGGTKTYSFSPPVDDQQQHFCLCRIDPTRAVEDLESMTYMVVYLVIIAAAVAMVMGLGFLYWLQSHYRSKSHNKWESKVRPETQSPEITKPSIIHRYRADSTTPERGRRLHRAPPFRPVNPLNYYCDNSRADDSFTGPVEVKRWIIRDDSTSSRENEDGHCYTRDPGYGPETNSALLPESFAAVRSAKPSPSETHRPFPYREVLARNQIKSQPTGPPNDLQDILDEPLNPVSSANTGSNDEEETESPTALFEETIALSRSVQRVEYKLEERESPQPPPISSDAVGPAQGSDGSASFEAAFTSIKNPDYLERQHHQHLTEKFKELETYQPGASSGSPAGVPDAKNIGSNGSIKNEGSDLILPLELDTNGRSLPASPIPSLSSSSSSSSTPLFGGFQHANGLWNIDQASTLPFGAKFGKKRRTRHRPRKGRARRKVREEAEAEAEKEAEGDRREAVSS